VKRLTAVLFTLVCTTTPGLHAQTRDSAGVAVAAAEAAAISWLGLIDRGEPLGARTLLSASYQTKLPGAPPGEYVVLQYRTTAGGGRAVVETVTPMKEPSGRWRVSGYYIRPP
jgi:hypothetical protein